MNISELVAGAFRSMTEGEKVVCRYIVANPLACSRMSVEQVARACNVSGSMVVRFAKRLGFAGFGELRARLKLWGEKDAEPDADTLLSRLSSSCLKMVDELSEARLEPILESLRSARRVYVHGSGAAQGCVAREMARIFMPMRELIPSQGHDTARTLGFVANAEDLVVIISLSGESAAAVELARALAARGVPTLAITRSGMSSLSELCPYCLGIQSIRIDAAFGDSYETSTPYYILIEYLYLAFIRYISLLGHNADS